MIVLEDTSDLLRAQTEVVNILGIPVYRADLLAIGVTAPLVLALTTFVRRSRLGKAMRATAQDPEAARLMGINVDTTISVTFLLGGILAGAAGLIYAVYETGIRYDQGFTAGLIAFTRNARLPGRSPSRIQPSGQFRSVDFIYARRGRAKGNWVTSCCEGA